jgi:hypothetical protein
MEASGQHVRRKNREISHHLRTPDRETGSE